MGVLLFAPGALAQPGGAASASADVAAVAAAEGAEGANKGPPAPAPIEMPSPQMQAAREAVAVAQALFEAGNYDAAVAGFERAYSLMGADPRRHPLLNNIAVCHERAFRYAAALHYYRRYLDEAAADAGDRAEVRVIIATLEGLLGTVELQVQGAPELWVDGRKVGPLPRAIKLPAGRRVLEFRAPGFEPQRREIMVTARQTTRLALSLTPIAELGGVSPHFFYLGVGLTAAAGITTAVLGGLLLHERNQANPFVARRGNLRVAETEARESTLARLELGTDIAVGATALLGTATVVVLLFTHWGPGEPDSAAPSRGHPRLTPVLAQRGGGLQLAGVFD